MKFDEQNFDKFTVVFIGKVLLRKGGLKGKIADHSLNTSKFPHAKLLRYTIVLKAKAIGSTCNAYSINYSHWVIHL